MDLSPKQLDEQSYIHLNGGWLELNSPRHVAVDDNIELTKSWITMLTKEPAYIQIDSLGRLWAKDKDGHFCPFHLECCGKLYGIRISKKAAN